MKIESQTRVSFHYRLFENGQELESSYEHEPTTYVHGQNGIISGLEFEMEGKQAGDTFVAEIPPELGYGVRNEEAVQRVPIERVHNHAKLKDKLHAGMTVYLTTPEGAKRATVIEAGASVVELDSNHPLAGKTLRFEVEVLDVQEQSLEDMIASGGCCSDPDCSSK